MDSKLDKIDVKIDRLDERLDSIDLTLVRQSGHLEEHMRRSLSNEEAVSILRSEIKPLSQHVSTINSIAKFISVMAALAGIYSFIKRL